MDDAQRRALLARARRIRADVQAIFDDAAYWNEHVRPPGEAPIDPDPEGDMRLILDGIDRMLTNDKGFGPLAPIIYRH
jgi:hypothetical protein